MNERVLVTGASGFVGRQTLTPLTDRGYEVHCVSSRDHGLTEPTGAHWHRADLHDGHAVTALMGEIAPSHLLHLAWYAEPGRFWTSDENLRWVEASLRLLRAFGASGGRRAVIAGTCAEYRWTDRTVCSEWETPLAPTTLYGASKHALHQIAERWAMQAGIELGWGRVFFVYGPGESPRRLGGSVASALVAGRSAPCSHGEQLRDFLCSVDLGAAFAALVDCGVRGAVNLASGRPMAIRELVTALAEAAGRPDLVEFGALPATAGEPAELTAEVGRLTSEVGWRPAATPAERARETIDWWRAQDAPAPSARVARS